MKDLSKIFKYLLISFLVLVAILILSLVAVVALVLSYVPFGELINFIQEFFNTNGENLKQLFNMAISRNFNNE